MSLKLAKSAKKNESKSPVEWLTRGAQASPLLQQKVGFADTTNLEPTDEDIFLKNLKIRFFEKQIYTCIESTVIAINPYEQLPLYSNEIIAAYEHHNIHSLPPHIFTLCEYVLHCLIERNADQCILTSGVIGSGKTESFKSALNYFIYGSNDRSELSQIKKRLSSIPLILEAFGNASTEHNANSTRMVYMLEINFNFQGDPTGGQISDYFLEKTRVARQEIFGYNFHIFYQLIEGAGTNLLKFLKLKRNIDSYTLLKEGIQSDFKSYQSKSEEFRKTKLTLQLLGFTSNEIIECFQVLGFILKLGNISFLRKANIDSTEGCTILADYEIVDICNAFQLDFDLFQKLLTQKIVKNQNDVFIAELSASSATKVKNSLCKALYSRLFTWLIRRINELVMTKPFANLARNNLALVDSFGFEKYMINCFEQLLINYLGEKIQQIFVDFNFRQEQEDLVREEIEWQPVDFNSNDLLVDLIERPLNGILSTLDKESAKSIYFREEIFIQNLTKNCESDFHFTRIKNPVQADRYFVSSLPYRRLSAGDISKSPPQYCFALKHYAGNVVYSINGFIEKNIDHISRDWSYLLYTSDHCLLKIMFPEGNPVRKNPKNPITLANQFMISIESIIAKLQSKQLHFIKCIRPNRLSIPNMFDDEFVLKQLQSHLLIEQSAFLKNAYFYKESYRRFFRRFRLLSSQTWPVWSGTYLHGVYTLLFQLFDGQLGKFAFGKKKVFVKNLKTVCELEELRLLKLAVVATLIQKNVRAWIQRKEYLRLLSAQIKISRCFRNWKRKRYLKWLSRHLPSPSPLARDWPPAPRSLKESSHLLRKLYHKWRCQRYRARYDQIDRNRMREKVTAMVLFRGRKASYRNSVSHPFRGDYIRLRQNAKWKRLLATLGEVYVVFADLASKITKRCGKFVPKILVITTSSFLVLDHKTMQINHNVKLFDIFKISCSPYMDNILIIHIYTDQQGLNSRAIIFESSHLIELTTKMYLVIQNSGVGRGPTLEISHEFQVQTGKETLLLIFKSRNQPTNEVKLTRKSNRLEIQTAAGRME